MAHIDGLRRYRDNPKGSPTTPTVEQLLQDEGSRWSASTPPTTSPTLGRAYDEDGDHSPLHKKSVLAKVKDKAKKWRRTLSKKKHGHDDDTTPPWGVSLDDDDEEDAEYLGAPMYESEMAPEGYKENARQHPRADPVISEKHVLASSVRQGENPPSPTRKTITETVTEKLAPAYATVSEATHAITSKIQGLAVSATSASAPATATAEPSSSNDQKWDKGVSVKEYLMHKLEPGEDERALSQVISEAMSPRKAPGGQAHDIGVVEKVKEAVTSLLRGEETTPSRATTTTTNSSSHIPVSTNAHEAIEEENHGRILQAN